MLIDRIIIGFLVFGMSFLFLCKFSERNPELTNTIIMQGTVSDLQEIVINLKDRLQTLEINQETDIGTSEQASKINKLRIDVAELTAKVDYLERQQIYHSSSKVSIDPNQNQDQEISYTDPNNSIY